MHDALIEDALVVNEWFARYRSTSMRLFTCPRPTIAAINDHAIAGGLITALCCDYRLAMHGCAKRALQARVLAAIEPLADPHDADLATGLTDPSNLLSQSAKYEQLAGTELKVEGP
jgi:enoyl-CoA hydratase